MKIKNILLLFLPAIIISSINADEKISNEKDNILYTYTVRGKSYNVILGTGYDEVGLASWYGDDFHNKLTASGKLYNKNEMVAAHKNLPLQSVVEVTNLKNNKKIKVTIIDRGPFYDDRIIDLSESAAKKLDFYKEGITKVKVKFIKIEKITNNFHKENKHLQDLNLISDNNIRALRVQHHKKYIKQKKWLKN